MKKVADDISRLLTRRRQHPEDEAPRILMYAVC